MFDRRSPARAAGRVLLVSLACAGVRGTQGLLISTRSGSSAALEASELADGPWAPAHLASGAGGAEGGEGPSALGASADGKGGFVLGPRGQSDLAWASWSDSLPRVGWSGLSVHTSEAGEASDGAKMYAAGLVEGFFTWRRIREFKHNSRALVEMNPENLEKLPQLQKSLAGIISELAGPSKDFDSQGGTPFDVQSRLALLQAWGLRDGYELGSQGVEPLSMVDVFILNSDGVIDELLSKYGGGQSNAEGDVALAQRGVRHHRSFRGRNPKLHRTQKHRFKGHCTGFARLSEDKSDLFFGHTTWESFSEMTRIWKSYDFPLQGVAAKKISFSSYPGCISSTDDYYLMDSGLAITETTLNIPREMQYPHTKSTPDFIRIMAANRLASNGEEWVQNMADSATGTYSSQWMVVDYNKFSGGELLPGTFYVLEQAPGISHFEDMSQWLQKEGYWASFDRAFFDDVRKRTGDSAMERRTEAGGEAAQAELYSKDRTPRAQIARQTAHNVNSLEAMRAQMTENRGTQEPVNQASLQNPRYAFSARDDLKDAEHKDLDGSPDGGVDAKITSRCLFQSLTAQAVSSPSHTSLPAFQWTGADGSETWPGSPHEGLPNVANFDWVATTPRDGSPVGPLDSGSCQ
mmetsp:Transcript_16983/g.59396  ORF Transcript_16983/g.59396 Transcript_16983/m.59396 type:complete len:634 (+) Transcript_16983:61-1962(+)